MHRASSLGSSSHCRTGEAGVRESSSCHIRCPSRSCIPCFKVRTTLLTVRVTSRSRCRRVGPNASSSCGKALRGSITDVCMCEYTSHGHCGALDACTTVDNDSTLELLCKTALSHVRAGADMVAPSDMMDGRVLAIRRALDSEGYTHIPIMAYSAKYASGFYGPFRDAAGSAPAFGDRRSYQMDIHNSDEAMKEIDSDVAEGADIVMVKPALSYLDIIRRAGERVDLPLAAYSVSGEYAMIEAAAQMNLIDRDRIIGEVAVSIFRAGADILITYHAKDIARLIDQGVIG